nr:MAG TPA: hypothetical protein [Caudoviricetes sp.]
MGQRQSIQICRDSGLPVWYRTTSNLGRASISGSTCFFTCYHSRCAWEANHPVTVILANA